MVKKSDLPPNAKLVALYLSTFMNAEHNIAWPSVQRIADETGLGKSTVQKWTSYLAEKKWIEKRINYKTSHSIGGMQKNNQYEIRIPIEVLKGVQQIGPLQKGGLDNDQRGSTYLPKGAHQIDPNNNINNNIITKDDSQKEKIKTELGKLRNIVR